MPLVHGENGKIYLDLFMLVENNYKIFMMLLSNRNLKLNHIKEVKKIGLKP